MLSMRNSKRTDFKWVLLVVVVTLIAAGCSGEADPVSASGSPASEDPVSEDPVSEDPAETTTSEQPSTTLKDTPTTTTTLSDSCVGGLAAGLNEIDIESGGLIYKVRIHVPKEASELEKLPVVVAWHGLTFSGPAIAGYSGLETLADSEQFLAVFPTGHPSPDHPVMAAGAGWELKGWADSDTKDDLAFAAALLDELDSNWCADSERTFMTGDSLGAMFTSVMVCELSDRIAAAASVSGIVRDESCSAARAVPFLAIHGTADDIVPFEADVVSVFGEQAVPQKGMLETFAEFADGFDCNPEPTTTSVGDETTRYDYSGCQDDVPLSFLAIEGDGHTWPGSIGIGEVTTDDFEATAVIWDFFRKHSK